MSFLLSSPLLGRLVSQVPVSFDETVVTTNFAKRTSSSLVNRIGEDDIVVVVQFLKDKEHVRVFEKLEDCFDTLFEEMGEAEGIDWLAVHPEEGQSVKKYSETNAFKMRNKGKR